MAFRLSAHKKNGQRTNSVLIEGKEARIDSSEKADIKLDSQHQGYISISETDGVLTLSSQELPVSIKDKELLDGSVTIGSGAQFECAGQQFYVTVVISGNPTPRRKSYLSTLSLTLIWSLLAIQLIVPVWLPYKITGHKVKGRNVLIENCSKGLDDLRKKYSKKKSDIGRASQIHRDIINRLSDEVEQMAWVFRNAGEFMSKSELIQLEKDIVSYRNILSKVQSTDAVTIEPLTIENTVRNLIKSE